MKSNDIPQKGGKEFLNILTEAHQAASGEEGQARPAGGQPELSQDPPEAKPERVGIHCCRRRARQGGGWRLKDQGTHPAGQGLRGGAAAYSTPPIFRNVPESHMGFKPKERLHVNV